MTLVLVKIVLVVQNLTTVKVLITRNVQNQEQQNKIWHKSSKKKITNNESIKNKQFSLATDYLHIYFQCKSLKW